MGGGEGGGGGLGLRITTLDLVLSVASSIFSRVFLSISFSLVSSYFNFRLEGQYPTPGSHRVPALLDPGDVQSLNQNTYRQFMHCMLTDEERACMEMVAK